MILADKIMNLRKQNGWSQEELADKLGISRQSVSKWESAMTIPDLDKILKMSALFGVSTDYLLKDEIEETALTEGAIIDEEDEKKSISVEEANLFMNIREHCSKFIAFATSLCILSPICLLILGAFSEYKKLMTENMASGMGTGVLLAIVAVAVSIFILQGSRLNKYEYIETEQLALQYGVKGVVEQRKNAYEDKHKVMLAAGVALCILGVIPVVVTGCFANEFYMALSVSVLLALVSIGVNLMVRTAMVNGSFQMLLEEGDFTAESKRFRKKVNFFVSAYWCVATAIYLAISLPTSNWHITWVVWPVAGVLFAGIMAALRGIIKNKNK